VTQVTHTRGGMGGGEVKVGIRMQIWSVVGGLAAGEQVDVTW